MKQAYRAKRMLLTLAAAGLIFAGCSNAADEETATGSAVPSGASPSASAAESASPSAAASSPAASEASGETKIYKDWSGHEVEISNNPQRVIIHGETQGDLLALGVVPVGLYLDGTKGSVYEDQLQGVEDVGFPFNVEKALTLKPDLIIFSNNDEAQYANISKVAPTATYNSFEPIEKRMTALGEMLGKQDEAAAWLANYHANSTAMWNGLREAGVGADETAAVFTMYPGNRLFIMAGAGLPQFLYDSEGFKAPAKVQELIDEGTGFLEISAEVLDDYAADRIFILTPVDPEAQQDSNNLTENPIWKGLPAVKEGKVYELEILKASGDALSREWMIGELPKLIK